MELKEMNLEQIETRIAELAANVETSESEEEVTSMTEELRSLKERKAELEALETRKAHAAELNAGAQPGTIKEERKEESTMKNIEEFRNSKEYVNAYAEYIKSGDDTEIRSLLTTNVGDGTVAVPQIVTDEVKTAWERNPILALITNKFEVEGNISQEYEISGDDATVHIEGSGAVSEENLELGIAELVPSEIIKWISFSKSVMKMRGEAFLRYVYREISHKIMKALTKQLIQRIVALPTTATATTPSAAKIKEAAAVGTVADAYANLCDDAENPVVIINKLTHATMKNAAYAAQYGIDPFEGLDVHYNDTLPAYNAASENDVWMIVGDFGFGCIANFPGGMNADVTIDTITKKKAGMVEACGDILGGAIPCACKAFCLVTKPATL